MRSSAKHTLTRKEFLRGFWSDVVAEKMGMGSIPEEHPEAILLPQGSEGWSHLQENCTKCYQCISVCPHEAIRVIWNTGDEREGLPGIYANLIACQNCEDKPCIQACTSGALKAEAIGSRGLILNIDPERCLTYKDQFCMTCVSQCSVGNQALTLNSESHPVWNKDGCTGCGICIQACPAPGGAFNINYKEQVCPSQAS